MDPIISEFHIYRFRLPFKEPLFLKGKKLASREGFVLKIIDAKGQTGIGEVAPLPEFSPENLAQALDQLQLLKTKISRQALPSNLETLKGGFESWLGSFSLSSSVRFGVEQAILNLIALDQEKPCRQFFAPDSGARAVPISALFQEDAHHPKVQVRKLLKAGFTNFKIKVGRRPIEESIVLFNAVDKALPEDIKIRLDANQSWNLGEALEFARAINGARIEYFEEPFNNLSDAEEFYAKTQIPIALDESLQDPDTKTVLKLSGLKALVLKPMILGGIEKTMGWIRLAIQNKLMPVISSSFETGIGVTMLLDIARATLPSAAGLDTLKWLKKDLLREPLGIQAGSIMCREKVLKFQDIDNSLLTEIK